MQGWGQGEGCKRAITPCEWRRTCGLSRAGSVAPSAAALAAAALGGQSMRRRRVSCGSKPMESILSASSSTTNDTEPAGGAG